MMLKPSFFWADPQCVWPKASINTFLEALDTIMYEMFIFKYFKQSLLYLSAKWSCGLYSQCAQRFCSNTFLPTLDIILPFTPTHGYLIVFIYIFLLTKQSTLLSTHLLATVGSSSVNCLFSCWVVRLFLLICRTFLYSGNESTLHFMCCKYLLPAVLYLLAFLLVFYFLSYKTF